MGFGPGSTMKYCCTWPKRYCIVQNTNFDRMEGEVPRKHGEPASFGQVERGARREAVETVRRMLDRDPAAPYTLDRLAGVAGLSRFQLHRAFREQLGLSARAYLAERRLQLARRLMREGEPIADAAVAAGFADQSHLTRCFQKRFGETPGAWRDRHLGPIDEPGWSTAVA